MDAGNERTVRVAVIGSGLAGMSAAHVLSQTPGFHVALFERNPGLGMDAGSIPVPCECEDCEASGLLRGGKGKKLSGNYRQRHYAGRIDVPMRSFFPGYYPYLTALYDSLAIPHKQSDNSMSFFSLPASKDPETVFVSPQSFPTKLDTSKLSEKSSDVVAMASVKDSYFTFSCYRIPPPVNNFFGIPDFPSLQLLAKDPSRYLSHVTRSFRISRDYFAFIRQCVDLMDSGVLDLAKEGKGVLGSLTFGQFMSQSSYSDDFWSVFLPLFSGACTCTFDDLKAFPAYIIIEYSAVCLPDGKMSFVTCGTKEVCTRLAAPIQQVLCSTTVDGIVHDSGTGKFTLTTIPTEYAHTENAAANRTTHEFDHVIFATQANQASRILRATVSAPARNGSVRVGDGNAVYETFVANAARVLDRFPYTRSLVVCHTDATLMPSLREEWRCLNFGVLEEHKRAQMTPRAGSGLQANHTANYDVDNVAMCTHFSQMTQTEVPESVPPLFQTTNPIVLPRPDTVISATWYERAIVRMDTADALRQLSVLQGGGGGVWFVGSFVGDGIPLLESCVTSAIAAAKGIVAKEAAKGECSGELFMPPGMVEKNIALVIGVNQIATKLNLERPEFIPYIRIAYFTVQAITLSVAFYIRNQITTKNDKTPLVYTEAKSIFEPKNLETVTTTNEKYDLVKSNESLQQLAIGLLMMCVMHFQFGYIRPLLLQAVLGLKNVYGTQLFRIHVLGQAATGDLKRPWKKSPFEAATEAVTPKEAKALEKKEEKKKLGKKSE
ncbi:hypothetical protein HDU84_006892 [Entophlyctis sp. JEL0112]|nr:hypothetical protein HDU84_006892 [Entophlyctis sp. JEL0112]